MSCRVVSRYRAAIAALMYPCSALCAWRAIASASASSVPSSGSTSNRSNATESVARSPCCATMLKCCIPRCCPLHSALLHEHPAILHVASRDVARCIPVVVRCIPCCCMLHPALLPVASRVVARCTSLHSEEPTQTAYCALWDARRRTACSTHSTITYRTAYACRRVESCGGCAPVAKTTHRSLQCAQQTNTQAAVAKVRRNRTQPQPYETLAFVRSRPLAFNGLPRGGLEYSGQRAAAAVCGPEGTPARSCANKDRPISPNRIASTRCRRMLHVLCGRHCRRAGLGEARQRQSTAVLQSGPKPSHADRCAMR